jgi:transposase
MFIRKTTRRYKGRTYTNHLLVESVRTDKGPRQRTVCSLGDLSPRPKAEWLRLAHRIEQALAGQADLFDGPADDVAEIVRKACADGVADGASSGSGADDEVLAVCTGAVCTEAHREAGPAHVGVQFWNRLGLNGILAAAGLSKRSIQLACAMTMNRLIRPASEHAMPDWIRRTALADILGIDFSGLAEDALYRNLDRLHPSRAKIETALAEKELTLFNLDSTVFFYDLTSTYFEGLAELNPKAKRGYSRDKRPDCKQVVVGLVIGAEGFPKAHEVFEGNMQDRRSLGPMLDAMHARVGLKPGQTIVIDRGMAFDENLEEIRSRGLHYLVATRQTERNEWLDEFEAIDSFVEVEREPSPNNPDQKKSRVRVARHDADGLHYVLCLSDGRSEKDRAIREKQEKRLQADLLKLQERVASGSLVDPVKIGERIGRLKERYPRVARYYRIQADPKAGTLAFHRDETKYARACELDGAWMLKTDRDDLSADEAWRTYITLTRAETAFRDMKSPLAERPIFHQLERRVETHIFLCVLAYHLLVAVEHTLREKDLYTSWATVRDTLATHQVCTVVLPAVNGDVLRIRRASTPEPEHKRLYHLLNIAPEIIRPVRTWTRKGEQM